MKFVDQTTKRIDEIPTKANGVISPSLLLPFNLEVNVKSQTVKVSENRRVIFDLLGILHSEQLNRKSVRG